MKLEATKIIDPETEGDAKICVELNDVRLRIEKDGHMITLTYKEFDSVWLAYSYFLKAAQVLKQNEKS